MTPKQSHALWYLRREGLQFEAEVAESAWTKGTEFVPNVNVPLRRETRDLIQQCNWELAAEAV